VNRKPVIIKQTFWADVVEEIVARIEVDEPKAVRVQVALRLAVINAAAAAKGRTAVCAPPRSSTAGINYIFTRERTRKEELVEPE
jgi:hypothetical protein